MSQNCTNPRNRPGCSAITRAAPAPALPASAIRLSFSLRADTNAVSAAVRIPFATIRSPRMSSSFAAFGMGSPRSWAGARPLQSLPEAPAAIRPLTKPRFVVPFRHEAAPPRTRGAAARRPRGDGASQLQIPAPEVDGGYLKLGFDRLSSYKFIAPEYDPRRQPEGGAPDRARSRSPPS